MTDLKKALIALKSIRSQCEDPSPDIDAIHRTADDAIYDIEESDPEVDTTRDNRMKASITFARNVT